MRKKPCIAGSHGTFGFSPGYFFDFHTTSRAFDSTHRVYEKHSDAPERNELKPSTLESIVVHGAPPTHRAGWASAFPRCDLHQ